jgi:hypothetical protein
MKNLKYDLFITGDWNDGDEVVAKTEIDESQIELAKCIAYFLSEEFNGKFEDIETELDENPEKYCITCKDFFKFNFPCGPDNTKIHITSIILKPKTKSIRLL